MSDAGKTKPLRFDKFTMVSIFGAVIFRFWISDCGFAIVFLLDLNFRLVKRTFYYLPIAINNQPNKKRTANLAVLLGVRN